MNFSQSIGEKITRILELGANGFHAMPKTSENPIKMLPSQHRLFNVIGMAVGFSVMKYLGDIAYGHKINGGEYQEIPKEKVPKILRPLHGIIHSNPFSDAPKDEWLTVLHKMLPAIGGAAGAIHGSNMFFVERGGKDFQKLLAKEKLTPLEAEEAITFAQGKTWGIGAGLTAWMGSVTGLTGIGYGGTLNSAFMLRNKSKSFAGLTETLKDVFHVSTSQFRKLSNTQSALGLGPSKAIGEMGNWVQSLLTDVKQTGDVNAAIEKLGSKAGRSIVLPFIRKATPEQKEQVLNHIRNMVEEAYKAGPESDKMKAQLENGIKQLLVDMKAGEFKDVFKEGDNGWLSVVEKLNPKLFDDLRARAGGLPAAAAEKPDSHFMAKALGVAGGAGVLGLGAKALHDSLKAPVHAHTAPAAKASSAAPDMQPLQHAGVAITPGMSAEQYVAESHKLKAKDSHSGPANGGLLSFARWVGDASLAVVPKNRFFCSLGLTAGGGLGLYASKLLSGKNIADNVKNAKEDFPKLLQPLHGLLKFDEHSSAMKDRWARLGALYTFTAISMVGIMVGAKHAYQSAYKANEKPDSLEDYMARVGQHQGDKWRWLAASSGVFGSTSGFFALPFVPGVNYGSSVAFYTVLNQDRKVMTPGLRAATGTKTVSYLGLREGLEYLTKYAEYNPSKNPAELEYLTLTVLGPVAHATGKELTAQQIKTFVDKIHSVRDKYWQEGGIPKNRQEDMRLEMDATFKDKGLDKTLYECGVDTMNIDFLKMNGLIGKVGNSLGAKNKILKDQDAYRTMAKGWRETWQQPPQAEEEQSQTPGLEMTRKKSFAEAHPPQPRVSTSRMPPLSYQDRVFLDALDASKSIVRAE